MYDFQDHRTYRILIKVLSAFKFSCRPNGCSMIRVDKPEFGFRQRALNVSLTVSDQETKIDVSWNYKKK